MCLGEIFFHKIIAVINLLMACALYIQTGFNYNLLTKKTVYKLEKIKGMQKSS